MLAEKFVEGVEVAVTVLDEPEGPRALSAVEINAVLGRYDYAARYTAGLATFHAPARLALGLTETSLLPMAIEADGMPLSAVFAELVERAVARG